MADKPIYLYVTPFFPSSGNWRGAYCYDFVRALMRLNRYRVLVFTEGAGADYEYQGVKVYRFPVWRLPSNILPFLFEKHNQRAFVRKVHEVLASSDIAVCHVNTANYASYALAIKELNPKCLTLMHHHCLSSFGLNMGVLRHCWAYNMLMFPQFRRRHEQIDCHVFISKRARDSFLAAPNAEWTIYDDYRKQMRGLPYRPVRIRRLLILHNGVDPAIFNCGLKEDARHHLPATNHQPPATTFTIGCIGNFTDLKGQETLIRAMELVAKREIRNEKVDRQLNFKVVFVGSGPTLDNCKRLAAEIERKVNPSTLQLQLHTSTLHFDFLPEVHHEQLPDFYRSLDLFVLPSYFEGFGCVYAEAWACGVPFIACEGQGVEDLIAPEDRPLWLCKPRDPIDLAAKIKYHIENRPEQRLTGPVEIDTLVRSFEEVARCDS